MGVRNVLLNVVTGITGVCAVLVTIVVLIGWSRRSAISSPGPVLLAPATWRPLLRSGRVPSISTTFHRCTLTMASVPAVDSDVATARRIGVQGTPGVIIAGVLRVGALPLADLERALQRAGH